MGFSSPPFPTSLRLSANISPPTQKQIHLSTKLFSPIPILRFTVGKFSQLPDSTGPEVALLGRSNVGKSSLLNALFPAAPHNFARVSSRPGHTKTLNGYTVPSQKFTIVDLPGYGYRGRDEWVQEVSEFLRSRRGLKKAYVLLDSVHGPKDTDIAAFNEFARTGLAHQIVLTKLDRATGTMWNELGASLRNNPVRRNAAVQSRSGSALSIDELEMGVWAPLRGQVGLGCDDTILGVSSTEGWGITALRCSILQACGAFGRDNYYNDEYLKALKEAPVIGDRSETLEESRINELDDHGDEDKRGRSHRTKPIIQFYDDNPMRGKVDGGVKTIRQGIYRW